MATMTQRVGALLGHGGRRRRDAGDRAASCAARVCILDRSHKWYESRWFPPLCGSRRSNPFFVLRRFGRKRGRLVRSEFSPSNRLPFAGWNQSGDHISRLVRPDIAASVNTSVCNFSGAVSPRRPDCRSYFGPANLGRIAPPICPDLISGGDKWAL